MLYITDLDAVPSLGDLVGVRGDRALIEDINRATGASSYFGSDRDRFRDNHRTFLTKFIEPIRRANLSIRNIVSKVTEQDEYRRIESEDDLRKIPPCMMIPMLTYDPMYSLLRQGRISGWGFVAENLDEEKTRYDRLIVTMVEQILIQSNVTKWAILQYRPHLKVQILGLLPNIENF